jgi:hypothetical protein
MRPLDTTSWRDGSFRQSKSITLLRAGSAKRERVPSAPMVFLSCIVHFCKRRLNAGCITER